MIEDITIKIQEKIYQYEKEGSTIKVNELNSLLKWILGENEHY